jgi:hypothetical protein
MPVAPNACSVKKPISLSSLIHGMPNTSQGES